MDISVALASLLLFFLVSRCCCCCRRRRRRRLLAALVLMGPILVIGVYAVTCGRLDRRAEDENADCAARPMWAFEALVVMLALQWWWGAAGGGASNGPAAAGGGGGGLLRLHTLTIVPGRLVLQLQPEPAAMGRGGPEEEAVVRRQVESVVKDAAQGAVTLGHSHDDDYGGGGGGGGGGGDGAAPRRLRRVQVHLGPGERRQKKVCRKVDRG